MTKSILESIAIKNRPHKKICRSEDPSKKRELETKVKIQESTTYAYPK